MKTKKRAPRMMRQPQETMLHARVRAAMLMLSCAMAGTSAQAEIAQQSLIIKDRDPVEPNLMFTLDDSGSMAFNYLADPNPEVWGHGPEHNHIFAYHPGEPRGERTEGSSIHPNVYAVMQIEGLAGTDTDILLGARQRSPQVNSLYYDPEVEYKPWVKGINDKTGEPILMENADPKKVVYHIGHPNSRFKNIILNIEGEHPVGIYQVCTSPRAADNNAIARGDRCTGDSRKKTVAPATYFLLKKDAETKNYLPNNVVGNFVRVRIMDQAEFPKGRDRLDCKSKADKCTQAEEYQNFANWFQYHRTRMHVAIAAVGHAFAQAVDKNVRVGYGRINKPSVTPVDGIDNKVIERGVRRFEDTESTNDRQEFFNWLNSRTGLGATPLHRAMQAVGDYYKRPDDRGPWSWVPGKGNGRKHLSCRRSYHILMTDGQYNFSTVANSGETQKDFASYEADSNYGTTITGKGGSPSYQYVPVAPYRGSVSGSLADLAAYYWRQDLRTDVDNEVPTVVDSVAGIENPSFWQNVTTFTLGFGVEGTLKASDWDALKSGAKSWPNVVKPNSPEAVDDLWHAGVNGRGGYLDVKNSNAFLSELSKVLKTIRGRPGTVGGVDVSSRALQAGNQKFEPYFRTSEWYGNLKSYALDANGDRGLEQWSAVRKLPQPALRRIFVGTGEIMGAKATALTWATLPANIKSELLDGSGLADASSGGKHNGEWLVAYLRGDRSRGVGADAMFRPLPLDEKEFDAGDTGNLGYIGHIVNSTPMYIGAAIDRGYQFLPATFGTKDSGAKSYRAFVNSKKADAISFGADGAAPACGLNGYGRRPGLVFVGSNSGFLHAFDAACGQERFAYAPFAVLREMGRSSTKTYEPRYLMDGPLVDGDAYLNGKWANVLVGTTGAGPVAMFALDVTKTRAVDAGLGPNSVLWELNAGTAEDDKNHTDKDLGHVMQHPEIGVLADGTWVVVTGNGYESSSKRAVLLVIRLSDGQVIGRLDTRRGSATNPNGLGGVRLVRDGNQVIIGAYAGDLHGNLWKFDLSSQQSSEWKIAFNGLPMFQTEGGRPITVAPATVTHPHGGHMVLVGTGKLFEVGDNVRPKTGSTPVEAIYGLWDNSTLTYDQDKQKWIWGKETRITADQIRKRSVQMQGSYAVVPAGDARNAPLNWNNKERGWRIDQTMISGGGQRSIVPPQLMAGLVLFETMSPLVDEASLPCLEEVNTPAFSLLVDPLSGNMATKAVIDTNGDKRVDDKDIKVAGWTVDDWTGRSVVLAQEPAPPCSGATCQQTSAPTGPCQKGTVRVSMVNVKQSLDGCVGVPGPSRWWWRELSVPDKTYEAGAVLPPPTASDDDTASEE